MVWPRLKRLFFQPISGPWGIIRGARVLVAYSAHSTGKIAQIVEDSRDCFRVMQLPVSNHLLQLLTCVGPRNDFLVVLRLRLARCQPFGEQQIHLLFQEAWCREKLQKSSESLRSVARFFPQFALRRFQWRFSLIDSPGHQLPQVLPRGVAVLLNQHNSSVRQHRKHHDRARMRNHFPRTANARRLDHFIPSNPEHFSGVHRLAAQHLGFLIGSARVGARLNAFSRICLLRRGRRRFLHLSSRDGSPNIIPRNLQFSRCAGPVPLSSECVPPLHCSERMPVARRHCVSSSFLVYLLTSCPCKSTPSSSTTRSRPVKSWPTCSRGFPKSTSLAKAATASTPSILSRSIPPTSFSWTSKCPVWMASVF